MLTHESTVTRFALDEAQGLVGVEPFHHDRGAAEDVGRDVRGPQAEAERRGHRAEEHVVARHLPRRGRELMEEEPAVLVVQHALRHAGGAGRGVDDEEIVGAVRAAAAVEGRVGRGIAVDGDAAACVAGDHDVLRDGEAVGAERVDELGGRATAVLRQGDDPLGAGLAQDVADLRVTGAMAETHDR